MDFEIGGCGGQPSIHWAAAQTQSKQMSAGGLNNPNTAAEWKEEHSYNWNATVCSLSTNREWAEWGLCHYRLWRSILWAPKHSFNVKAKEHGLKLAFLVINLLIYICVYIYEITIKLSFWALMVIVNMKTGFYELIMCMHWHSTSQALPFDSHKTFFKVSCLTGPHTHSWFNAKTTSNDGELFDREHGKVPQCLSDRKNGMNAQISSQPLISVVFGQLKFYAFFQKYFLFFLQIEFSTLNESKFI